MFFKSAAIVSLALGIAISGCASHSGVVAIGAGKFMLAKQQATGFPGLGNMKAELLQEAAVYCKKDASEMELLNTKESQPPYILGNYPRVEIEFSCRK